MVDRNGSTSSPSTAAAGRLSVPNGSLSMDVSIETSDPENSPLLHRTASNSARAGQPGTPPARHERTLPSAATIQAQLHPAQSDQPLAAKTTSPLPDHRLPPTETGQCHHSVAHGKGRQTACAAKNYANYYTPRAVDDGLIIQQVFRCPVVVAPVKTTVGGSPNVEQNGSSDGGSSVPTDTDPTGRRIEVGGGPVSRWADRACQEIQFIDDDCDDKTDLYQRQCSSRDAVYCTASAGLSAREIMQSTQMLAELLHQPAPALHIARSPRSDIEDSDTTHRRALDTDAPRRTESEPDAWHLVESSSGNGSDSTASTTVIADIQSSSSRSFEPHKTRLTVPRSPPPPSSPDGNNIRQHRSSSSKLREMARNALCSNRSLDRFRGKRGLCGIANPILPGGGNGNTDDPNTTKSSDSSPRTSNPNSPVLQPKPLAQRCGSLDARHLAAVDACGDASTALAAVLSVSPNQGSASLPASPVHKLTGRKQGKSSSSTSKQRSATLSLLGGRSRLQSPLIRRRLKSSTNAADSSDDEYTLSAEEITTSENYRNLETFQKAQLNKKVTKFLFIYFIRIFIQLVHLFSPNYILLTGAHCCVVCGSATIVAA